MYKILLCKVEILIFVEFNWEIILIFENWVYNCVFSLKKEMFLEFLIC